MVHLVILNVCAGIGVYFAKAIPVFLYAGKRFTVLAFVLGLALLYRFATSFKEVPGTSGFPISVSLVFVSCGILVGLIWGYFHAQSIIKTVNSDEAA